MLADGGSRVGACDDDYSSDEECRIAVGMPARTLTRAETARVAAVIDKMKSRVEAGDPAGGGTCDIPCFRRVYVRDGVKYETYNACNDIYPAPHMSQASSAAIYALLYELQGMDPPVGVGW